MDQGLISFAGLSNIQGGEMTFHRGVRPSFCMIKMVPPSFTVDKVKGQLKFTFGTSSVTFENCRVVEVVQENFVPRGGRDFHIKVADRRIDWRYKKVDGNYNITLGGVRRSAYEKTARQLATILLDALGESGYDVSEVSDSVYPLVMWNRARADLELEWLCDLLGLVTVLGLDDKVRIEPLNDVSGSGLPAGGIPASPTDLSWKSAVMPETLRVQGEPTIVQSELDLTPYGYQIPKYEVRESDWPEWHARINTTYRHYAYMSVYRHFVPTGGWDGDGVTVNSYEQIEIQDTLSEIGLGTGQFTGQIIPLPPRIRGDFWTYGEVASEPLNDDEFFTGDIRILPGSRVVELDRPVFKMGPLGIQDPVLKLLCSYKIRKPDGDGYSVYTKDKSLTETGGTGIRVLNRPHLQKIKIVDTFFNDNSPSDNEASLDAEADVYLDGVDATYNFDDSRSVIYNGIVDQELDGAISMIKWRAGLGLLSITTIGRFTEFDIYAQSHQARRAANRLIQLSERFSL